MPVVLILPAFLIDQSSQYEYTSGCEYARVLSMSE